MLEKGIQLDESGEIQFPEGDRPVREPVGNIQFEKGYICFEQVELLLLSHINSCQTSEVRGHKKVLEP